VFLLRMPDIIRLRVFASTTSAIDAYQQGLLAGRLGGEERQHDAGHFADGRHHDRVPKLLVGACIRHRDNKAVRKAHQACALSGSQATRELTHALVYEYLGSIFVITRREGSGHVIRSKQTKSETITFGLVLRLVLLQVIPQAGSQRIFLEGAFFLCVEISAPVPRQIGLIPVGSMENFAERDGIAWGETEAFPVKSARFAKPCYQNALSVLRNEVRGVQHPPRDVIAQFVAERSIDHVERAASIVGLQIFYVFEKECSGFFFFYDSRDIKKQRALGLIRKTVSAT